MEDFEKELAELSLDSIDLSEIDSLESVKAAEKTDRKDSVIQDALGGITTYVDIVFCIDVTQSMSPIIETVKNLTLDLYDDLVDNMARKNNRIVKQLRVKVIAFRDYYCDGAYAMEESDFFVLPEQKNELRSFVASLQAKGGGDEPENALEAMALAMRSDWVRVTNPNSEKARNVVVIFTDASAHPLEKAADGVSEYYPSNMLKSYTELYEAWCGQGSCAGGGNIYAMDKMAERLVIFAPEDAYPWSDMAEEINYAAVVPISETNGGAELGRDTIISTISGSMC